MGMFLRRGLPPSKIRTVSIVGKYFSSSYVLVGETKYSKAAEVSAEIGTTVVVSVDAPDDTGRERSKIYLDGKLVQSGAGDYTLTVQGNLSIEFTRLSSSYSAVECYIVTK